MSWIDLWMWGTKFIPNFQSRLAPTTNKTPLLERWRESCANDPFERSCQVCCEGS